MTPLEQQIAAARLRVARAQAWLAQLEAIQRVMPETALSSPQAAVLAHVVAARSPDGRVRCARCHRVLETDRRFSFAVGVLVGELPAEDGDGGGFCAFNVEDVPLCVAMPASAAELGVYTGSTGD